MFPDTYHVSTLAGKDVEFDIVVQSVETAIKTLKEYIAKYHPEGGMEEIEKMVKEGMDDNTKYMKEVMERKKLFDYLETIEFETIPSSMLQKTKMSLSRSYSGKELEDMAERQVKCNLILDEYVDKLSISANEDEITGMVFRKFSNLSPEMRSVIQFREAGYEDILERLRTESKQELLAEKVSIAMIEKMKPKEVKVSFEELKGMIKSL